MIPVVVDASVAVKWFVPEVDAGHAARLLDGDLELLAPELVLAESANAVWKKVRRGELTEDEGRQVVAAIREAPFAITPATEFISPAYEIAIRYRRTIYDALYVALAVAHDGVLVTGDARLAAAFEGGPIGKHVRRLADWDAGTIG